MSVVRPSLLISPLRPCFVRGRSISTQSARFYRRRLSPRPFAIPPNAQQLHPMHTTSILQNPAIARDLAPTEDTTRPHIVHRDENVGRRPLADFDLKGRVFVVTGGAQGLGLALAEGLVEAGGKVYCLDRSNRPHKDYAEAQARVVPEWGGSLYYRQQDVTDAAGLDEMIASIADEHQRLDGVVAAAAVQQICPAAKYTMEDAERMMKVNYTGVMMTATSAARQMFKYKCHGSICLIASMSGIIANKGLYCPVYNSSKAAVIQLARCLAMEWSPIDKHTGAGGIRVNCLSPGHIVTPMVLDNFAEVPGLREKWESENMMGRLAETSEFKGAVLYLMSRASGFMTGGNLVIDGGHTAW